MLPRRAAGSPASANDSWSLAVLSGFRYARGAAERGLPVAIVNQGPTRADSVATLRVDAAAGLILPALAARLLR